ncbi:hypothetical protein KCU76_g112, partial [Aureobasidium melanogenum]
MKSLGFWMLRARARRLNGSFLALGEVVLEEAERAFRSILLTNRISANLIVDTSRSQRRKTSSSLSSITTSSVAVRDISKSLVAALVSVGGLLGLL